MKIKNIIKFIEKTVIYTGFHRILLANNIILFASNLLINIISFVGTKLRIIKDANFKGEIHNFDLKDFQDNPVAEVETFTPKRKELFDNILKKISFNTNLAKDSNLNIPYKDKITNVIINLIKKNDKNIDIILNHLSNSADSVKITFHDTKYVAINGNYLLSHTNFDTKHKTQNVQIALNHDSKNIEASLVKELTRIFCHEKFGKYYDLDTAKKSMSYFTRIWHKSEDLWAYITKNPKDHSTRKYELSYIDRSNPKFSIINPYNFYDNDARKEFKNASLQDNVITRAGYIETLIYKPIRFNIIEPYQKLWDKCRAKINRDHKSYWEQKNQELIVNITPSLKANEKDEQNEKDEKFQNLFVKEINILAKKERHAEIFAKIPEAVILFGEKYVNKKIPKLYELYEKRIETGAKIGLNR